VPSIADLEGLPLSAKEVLIEKFDLQPEPADPQRIYRDSDKYLVLIGLVMLEGWNETQITNGLIKKGMVLSGKDESHLNELRKFGAMVKANEMDVTTLIDQSCLSEIEKKFLAEKYKSE
jgi:hypothetical protein